MSMNTSKEVLNNQANQINELLKELGVDIGVSINYAYLKPRLMAHNESQSISMIQSKIHLDYTLYAVKNILLEISIAQKIAKIKDGSLKPKPFRTA